MHTSKSWWNFFSTMHYHFTPEHGPGIRHHMLTKCIANYIGGWKTWNHTGCLRKSFSFSKASFSLSFISLFLGEVQFLMLVEPATIWPLLWWTQNQGYRTDRWVADVSAPCCCTTSICPPCVSFRNERWSSTKEYLFINSYIPRHEIWPYGQYTLCNVWLSQKKETGLRTTANITGKLPEQILTLSEIYNLGMCVFWRMP